MRRLLLLVLLVGCGGSIPTGPTGAPADALANRMLKAVNAEGWERTGAVRWTFAGRNEHLWDRQRSFVRVKWGETVALLDLTTRAGKAWESGAPLAGEALAEALDGAHARWINDSFWLNPVVKVYDEGVERRRVELGGREALRVTYTTGGRTPGDTYVWLVADDGTPTRWAMWTSNVPVGGTEASWDGWITLPTGARLSTLHEMAVFTLKITDVAGAATLAELVEGEDPFAALR